MTHMALTDKNLQTTTVCPYEHGIGHIYNNFQTVLMRKKEMKIDKIKIIIVGLF